MNSQPRESTQTSLSQDAASRVPVVPVVSSVGPLLGRDRVLLRYGCAVLLVLAIFAIRLALDSIMGRDAPLLPFILAVFGAGIIGGLGPALLATLLVPALATPVFSPWQYGPAALAWSGHVAFFVTISGLVSVIVHRLQVASAAQRTAVAVAQENEALLQAVATELREAQTFLSMALRAGRAGSFSWDIRNNQNFWSRETLALHGLDQATFDGSQESWLESIHAEDRAILLQGLARARETGELRVEYRVRHGETGEIRWIHSRGKVMFDEAGDSLSMIGINADITERRRAEEALREVDRRKDEFLAMLAHELRNPLASIRSVAYLLGYESVDPATVRRNTDILNRQVNVLTRLVDDLLDVARITRGSIALRKECVPILNVLTAALEAAQPVLAAKHQTVDANLGNASLIVEADAVRLCQVFANILMNAAKFSPDGAVIDLSVEEAGDDAMVRVRDDGMGIDPEDLPYIFDLFVQADRSLGRPQGGIGVGLTVAKALVEMHSGRIEAESAGAGRGSLFTVRLPLAKSVAPLSTRAQPRGETAVRRRVLVVDDNVDAAESLAVLLKMAGHDTATAYDGESALAAVERAHPEVILLDIGMPGLDGYAVARLIRERFSTISLRVYALTGYGREEDKARALESGFDGHLTKPVDSEQLFQLLAVSM
jgi:PAS domain S-box-containing protein